VLFFVEFLHDKNGTTKFIQSKSRDLVPRDFQHLITSISYELVWVCEKRKHKTSKSFMQKIGNLIVQHHKYWFVWCSSKMQVNEHKRKIQPWGQKGFTYIKSCGLRIELEMFISLCSMWDFFQIVKPAIASSKLWNWNHYVLASSAHMQNSKRTRCGCSLII
jgi:hypothetical protein